MLTEREASLERAAGVCFSVEDCACRKCKLLVLSSEVRTASRWPGFQKIRFQLKITKIVQGVL